MLERVGRNGRWLLIAAALVAIVSVVALSVGESPPERPYSAFLAGVGEGRVTSVVQTGSQLEVVASDGTYLVEVPSVLTDVYGEIQTASGGTPPPAFEARPAADPPWVSLGPIFAINLVVVGVMVVLAIVLLRRRPGSTA